MRDLLYYLFIFFFCNISLGAEYSQHESPSLVKVDTIPLLYPIQFDEEKIIQYKDERAFDYLNIIEQESWWTRFKSWLGLKYKQIINWLFGEYETHSIISFFLLLLPYFIIGSIIGLIIWLFIRLNPGSSLLGEPPTPEVYLSEEGKLVHNKDLSALLDEALKNKDFRLAVRYNYLKLLKLLNQKGLIVYEFQKTDNEYLAELKDHAFKLPLKKVMRIYDFTWYGNFPVTEEEFRLAQKSFQSIEFSLNKKYNE